MNQAGIAVYNESLIQGRNSREKHNRTNHANFNFIDKSFDRDSGTSYYYARITLKNGEMAWSSPIWVMDGKKRIKQL